MEDRVWSGRQLDTVSLRRKERMLVISSFLEDLACWNLGMFYKFINLKLLFFISFFLSQNFYLNYQNIFKRFFLFVDPLKSSPGFSVNSSDASQDTSALHLNMSLWDVNKIYRVHIQLSVILWSQARCLMHQLETVPHCSEQFQRVLER